LKTLIDNTLTHTLLNNIINLENSVIEKDCEIINLKKEMKRLETLVCEVTEKNISQTEKIENHVNYESANKCKKRCNAIYHR